MRKSMRSACAICVMFAVMLMTGCRDIPPQDPPYDPEQPAELVEGTFDVAVDELTAEAVTITITPSKEVDYYYAILMPDTEAFRDLNDELVAAEELAKPDAEQMIFRGSQTLTFEGLIGHSHYTLIYFQYNSEENSLFGELHRSERITTPDGEEAFDIEVTSLTGLGASLSVSPDDKSASYYLWFEPKENYEDKFEASDYLLVQNDFGYWLYVASLQGIDNWLDVMADDLVKGTKYLNSDDICSVLMWNTEYMVYAYGINAQGNMTTQLTKHLFSTPKSAVEDLTFDIDITSMEWSTAYNRYAVDAHVIPSKLDVPYFVTITNLDWYEWYFTDANNGRSDEDYIIYQILLNTSSTSHDILADYRLQGEATYKPYEARNQYLNPSKRYGVFVFGLSEDGPTTPLAVYEFETPARQ